jgi:hypothetical protein
MVDEFSDGTKIFVPKHNIGTISRPDYSEWQCYLFGNRPGKSGMIYRPTKGNEPNWFARWMMRICFDCLWVKDKNS